MSIPCRKAAAGLLVAGLLAPASALALDNDPALRGFSTCNGDGICRGRQDLFRAYAKEMGMAMAPKLLAPAETLGLNGFSLSLGQYSVTNIHEDEEHWQRGTEQTLAETIAHEQEPTTFGEAAAPGVLHTIDFRARKGLPYSFEVGTSLTYLVNSEFFAFGGELKWALNEAVDAFPIDIAVQTGVNRCFGSTELDLTTVGMNVILSRGFGAGGVVNIAPYMAYNPVFVFARSGVLDATPGIDEAVDARDAGSAFVLEKEDATLHRAVFGARFVASVLSITPEIALALGEGLQNYNIQLGLDF
jgi:hypothetical protein